MRAEGCFDSTVRLPYPILRRSKEPNPNLSSVVSSNRSLPILASPISHGHPARTTDPTHRFCYRARNARVCRQSTNLRRQAAQYQRDRSMRTAWARHAREMGVGVLQNPPGRMGWFGTGRSQRLDGLERAACVFSISSRLNFGVPESLGMWSVDWPPTIHACHKYACKAR